MILLNYPGHIIAVTLAVIIAAFILFSYRHKSVRRVRLRVIPLALLQFTAFLIVLFILWNPVIAEMTESKTRNSVLLLFDTSESMSVANNGAKSRLDNAVDLFIKKFSPDDPEGPVFEIYGFDRDYYYAGSLDGLVRWGDKSSLISPIELLAKQSALNGDANRGSGSVHGKVAGAIIFTDGQVLDKNMSLYPSADELEFPVAVVGVGSSNAQYDLAVKSMKTPGRAAMNTSFVVEITVGSINEGSENVIIELLEDEQVISSREIPAKDISEDMAVSFNVAADKPGAHSLVARIGSNQNEINRANNSRAAIYEVIDDRKINVLFYSQVANFDVGKIRQALSRDEKVRLDMKMDVIIPQMNKYYDSQVKLPSSTNGYDDYDVVILGPCMGDALDEMQIESLYRFVADRGGGLILLPGHGVMDSSSWKNDKLRRLVPAFSDIDDPTQKYDMRKVSLSPGGMNSKFVEQSLFETYKPEAMAFKSSMRKKPAATSFASIDNTPALVVHRIGRGKVCMVNISRLFHWYREDLEGGFLRVFMSGLTEYAGRVTKSESGIEFFADCSDVDSGKLKFDIFLKDNYSDPIANANVQIQIGQDILQAAVAGDGHYSIETEDYVGQSIIATARGELSGLFLGEKSIVVNQKPVLGEMDNVGLDSRFLEQLAERIGGKYCHLYYFNAETLDIVEATSTVKNVKAMVQLWPQWWLLTVLCVILTVQWFLRRAFGLV